MSLTDKEFREAFKPLQIPADYHSAESQQDKILFALAQLGGGTSREVTTKLVELDSALMNDQLFEQTDTVLSSLYKKGLLNGGEKEGKMSFNLSKITKANEGDVDPDLLEP